MNAKQLGALPILLVIASVFASHAYAGGAGYVELCYEEIQFENADSTYIPLIFGFRC